MKILEHYEQRKGNKLIFKQTISDIPSIGSVVLAELKPNQDSKSSTGKQQEIGTIIDVFGPVKEPWVVVNLKKDFKYDFTKNNFYWLKYSKNKSFNKKKSKKNRKGSEKRNKGKNVNLGKSKNYKNRKNKIKNNSR